MSVGVGKMFVKLSFYSMVYPSTRSYVIMQFCVCFCPSVCLRVRVLSVYVSVRPCVRPSACMHIFVIFLLLYRFVCFLSVRSSVRSSVRLVVFRQYVCMPVSLLSVYMSVTYFFSSFLLLISNM